MSGFTVTTARRLHAAGDHPHRRLALSFPAASTNSWTQVVPELQRRGLFRREYEGRTLRENLGLPRPSNRFFETRKAAE